MKYTVVWKPPAETELAALWLRAADRAAVTAAADRIDQLLAERPDEQGESRVDSIRVMFEAPLGVFFHVSDADRVVSVLRVWRFA